MRRLWPLLPILFVIVPGEVCGFAPGKIDFARDIRPIFQARCVKCHGADRSMGQLRLDMQSHALRGGVSGPAIIPRDLGKSLLFRRITSSDAKFRMPKESSPLTKEQIELVRVWIDQGAIWPETRPARHWAYVKPILPKLPRVENTKWMRNPIDAFVMSKLEKEGLAPSREASRETLIRRVSLDLTGLPPGVEQLNEFLDDKKPGAYERLVDRLLASPQYGERWARPWLDLARYADTNGHETDNRRSIWKYRDWVIHALNADLPFDRFTIDQIAGDMLPNATRQQKIATGFHRNTMHNEEDGVDQEEGHWEAIVDRVNTTATVWLGSTLACAQCHDHKYDPFTQKDYYRFFAFFDNADYHYEKMRGYHGPKLTEAQLRLPLTGHESEFDGLESQIDALQSVLNVQSAELDAAQVQWEHDLAVPPPHWVVLDPTDFSSSDGATITRCDDQSLLVSGKECERDTYTVVSKTTLTGITAFRLEVLPDKSLPGDGPGRAGGYGENGEFDLTTFTVRMGDRTVPLIRAAADFSQDGFPVVHAIDTETETGWAIWPQIGTPHTAIFATVDPLKNDNSAITVGLAFQSKLNQHTLGRFRLSATAAPIPWGGMNLPENVRRILEIPRANRTDSQKTELAGYYRSIAPSLDPVRERLRQARLSMDGLGFVTTLVMRDRSSSERPSTYFRIRGGFVNRGEKTFAGIPSFLHPLRNGEAPNRLGLARWLVDENNPLAARVVVNRFWEQFFGRGLVETSEDFGSQGTKPTHPELLDWLAIEFMRQGWSMKTIHRLIVTSAAYRQSSRLTPSLWERDPYNRLLARGPRFRLEAEMVRDVALSVSGLLSRKIGGPSVFPYQPDGVWGVNYNDEKWIMSEGEDRFRRSIYTFLRRTSPYPSLSTLDAPSREFCVVRRVRTNTPLQALTLLNDPAFFESAKGLARRICTESPADVRARVDFAFRLCVSRHSKPEEADELSGLFQRQLNHFRSEPKAAMQVAGDAELAAWTVVANVLLNLDETVTRE